MLIQKDYSHTIVDTFKNVQSIEIVKDNVSKEIEKEDINYVLENLKELLSGSRLEPSFGVSLHNETIEALKKDMWLKIIYKTTTNKNGYLFDELLIKIEKTYGFNVIRKFNNKYEGRCLFIYLEEEKDLKSIIKKSSSEDFVFGAS